MRLTNPRFARSTLSRYILDSTRAGKQLWRTPELASRKGLEESAMHVLFVCTGNICRSPMAERLMLAYAGRSGIRQLEVSSAGTHALVGHPMEPSAARVLEDLGGEPSQFSARQLTPPRITGADLVLCMTRSHRDAVLRLAPQQLNRTFTLEEAARLSSEGKTQRTAEFAAIRAHVPSGDALDIPDPIGRNEAYFRMVGERIARVLPPILEVCRNELSA
ncbi:arsenate reductase/protein-tyrosine-phosphatase family protein [Mycolicibacterium rutilum]|uniref:arsenate reductase/protein-tyrosine-phosphatase family protein n=1 Tax=Mycolicibacterium rutilum TaxID=370526 RepID=UPI002ADE2A79|nr:low molecular weight phosphatase family protein [Mycolicibacterium rutilum]